MTLSTAVVRHYLRNFEFEKLFIEELGWDHYSGSLDVQVDGQTYTMRGLAEKRGVQIFACQSDGSDNLPDYSTRQKIDKQVTRSAYEHIIFVDDAYSTQIWQWVARQPGQPAAYREYSYYPASQSGDALIQKLNSIMIPLDEEEALDLTGTVHKLRDAFDRDRVTRRFYDHFKREHAAFLDFIKGITEQGDREWYASLMLNRLMFVYFIQKKGFLDANPNYLQDRLQKVQARKGKGRFLSFYYVRGSYIQIRMFADRLEVQSPGGLFGNVTVDNIEEEHSTRNVRLMRMMEDMHIVENRGSGIKAMLSALRAANLEPPAFDDRRSSFKVTFRNHTLMNPDAVAWLNQFADLPLNDRQRLALVYLRQHQQLNNGDYRRLNRVDPTLAGQDLRGLVDAQVIAQEGIGRWTHYRLKVAPELPAQRKPQTDSDRIIAYVWQTGSITNPQCRELLDVDDTRAYYLLKKLCDAGRLRPEGKGKWRKYVLP